MTIKPKKKAPKDKSEGDSSDHPPRSPTGESLGHVSRRATSPPPRWNSPSPRDDRLSGHDPAVRYEAAHESSSGYKRRHRSSPHRNTRKHRHDRMDRGGWETSCSSTLTRPIVPSSRLPMVPSTSTEEEHNSGDEYTAPALPEDGSKLEECFEEAIKEKRGFIIKKMANDGACMFRAVADQVYGDQEMHHVVRRNCVDYLAKNQDFFGQYVTEDFDMYLARKQEQHCHGNHIEMQVMAEIFNRPIEVYQYSTEPINTFHSTYKTDNEPIRVSYHGNVHYNSIVHPYKATVGVGLGLPGYQPGLAEKNLMLDATKKSEEFHIEQTMLEDKLRETDWELTQETIEEQVARESYLQWLKEQEKRANTNASQPRTASATCSSASASQSWWEGAEPSKPRSPRSPSSPTAATPVVSPPPPAPVATASAHPAEMQTAVPGCSAGPRYCDEMGASGSDTASLMNTDLPPQMFGIGLGGEWDEEKIMAQVMAQSQQEYLNSLKQHRVDPDS